MPKVELVLYGHPLVPLILVANVVKLHGVVKHMSCQFQGKLMNWCHQFWPQITGGHKNQLS